MMPISFWTLAWRMSKLTSGNLRLICQMIGCSTCSRVGKVNQQRLLYVSPGIVGLVGLRGKRDDGKAADGAFRRAAARPRDADYRPNPEQDEPLGQTGHCHAPRYLP